MIISELLKEKNLTMYKLSKLSGVPQSTISDLCLGKTSIEKCTFGNIYRIAKALNIQAEDLMQDNNNNNNDIEDFDLYRSNICQTVKNLGHINFLIYVLESNEIEMLYKEKHIAKALYLLSMVDYLSRLNNIKLCNDYNHIRKMKLKNILYPSGILIESKLYKDEKIKEKAFNNSIPEFKMHNIVENEIEKVA